MTDAYPDYGLIARQIKTKRKTINMTQEKLAEEIDISVRHMSDIETARKKVSLRLLFKIAKTLGTTLDPLVYGDLPENVVY